MRAVTAAIGAAFFVLAHTPAMAQATLQVPQSVRLQHEQIINRLEHFARSKDAEAAAAARRAAELLKQHYAKEEQYVLPPLALLPRLAKGEISKDMEPAIAMAERTKATLSELEDDHVKITSLMNDMIALGRRKKNDDLVRLATRVAAQSLNDIEVNYPAAVVIGDYLRLKLSRQD